MAWGGVQVTGASTLELVKGRAPTVQLDDKHYKLVDKVTTCLQPLPAPLGPEAEPTFAPSRPAEPQITTADWFPSSLPGSDRLFGWRCPHP